MVLASVDWGCGAGWDGASYTLQAVSTGPGAGSSAGVSRSQWRQWRSAGPTGHCARGGSMKSSDDGGSETRVTVRSGAM
ncbi:hypothetical protein NDU88_003216 [Pleurodeles waltl]|uniref:MHC class I antigen n=1 Tax=Pleurodeles waltl TaxID=8319 RepID=A0AAV7RGR9_PLEWA|nr:hypothetical protein NDU88_003216 [Pleurodeles waltl]